MLAAALPALAQAPAPPSSPTPPAPDSPEANKTVVRHYLQILSGGALDELDQVIGPDFVDRTPGSATGVQGPDAIRESQRRARELFQDIRYSVADVLAEGDRVAARYTVRAKQKGSGGGGKQVEVLGITLFRLAAGKIRETWIVNDQIELFRQLGFTLRPPAEAPKPSTPPGHPGR